MIETSALLDIDPTWHGNDLWFDADFIGPGYAEISAEGIAAVRLAARSEGVLLDTTYTGKAFAGLIGLVEKGLIRRTRW